MDKDAFSFSFEDDDSGANGAGSAAQAPGVAGEGAPPGDSEPATGNSEPAGDPFATDLDWSEIGQLGAEDDPFAMAAADPFDEAAWQDEAPTLQSDAPAAGNPYAFDDAVRAQAPPPSEAEPGSLDFAPLPEAQGDQADGATDGATDSGNASPEAFDFDLPEPAPATALSATAASALAAQTGSQNQGEASAESEASAEGQEPDEITVGREPAPEGRRRLRVAILGASGIGRNHAIWFARHGAEVVGFLGSSSDSVAATREELEATIGFQGRAFTDLSELLSQVEPEAVCVATPPHMHFSNALDALEAGAHVLCEKPLVYVPGRSARENRDGARELTKVARQKKLVLATQLQYAAMTPLLCRLAGAAPESVGDCAIEIETHNPRSSLDPRELWIDLGAHPISVVQSLAGPKAKLASNLSSFEARAEGDTAEVAVRFGVEAQDGRLITARAIVRRFAATPERQPRRRFAFNGNVISYAGLAGADGVYRAEFSAPDGYVSHYADPVDYLVDGFVRACIDESRAATVLPDGEFGAQNIEWLLGLLPRD